MHRNNTTRQGRLAHRTAWRGFLLGALLAVVAAFGAVGAPPKQVLLLHSFGREFAPFNTFPEIFRTELGQRLGEPVEFHDVALEIARSEGIASEGPLVEYLTALFGSRRLDLLVTIGGPAGTIKTPPQVPGRCVYDWRELNRWGIREIQLPAGSVDRFRQPTFWETYWRPLAGAVSFCLLQAALIMGLLINRTKRRHGEAVATLTADLSSKFINLPAGEVDREIEDAQRQVCECLGLDLSTLWQWTGDTPRCFRLTHLYRALGGPPTAERFDLREAFPWCVSQLAAGKTVSVSSLELLPPEAIRDKESWHYFGIKSNLTFPLSAGEGQIVGALGFNTMRKERAWPEEVVKRLQLVAQIFANALTRRRADQALRESEERFRLLMKQAPEAIVVLDLEQNRLVQANAEAERLFGCGRQELLATDPQRFYSSEQSERKLIAENMEAHIERALRGETVVFERAIRNALGQQLHCELRLVRLPSDGRALIRAIFINITERKRAEEALRDFAERYQAITKTTTDAFWEVDGAGKIVAANDQSCRLLGLSRDELLTKLVQDLEAIQNPAEIRANLERIIAMGSARFETQLRGKEGRLVAVEVSTTYQPSSRSFLTFLRDITERKRAEEAMLDLSGRLIDAQEAERARVARELHDGLSQNLALHTVELELLGQRPPTAAAELTSRMQELSAQMKRLSTEVHRISHDLHPAKLTQLGLTAAVAELCHEVLSVHRIPIAFDHNGIPRTLPLGVALCLYRVAQESLQNIVKHSNAKQAGVELKMVQNEIRLCITDDGGGFDVESKRTTSALGLVSIRERVRLLKGRISVRSRPGEGTRIEVAVPIKD